MQFRIWRSSYTRFGGLNSLRPDSLTDETITAVHNYSDQDLQQISANGFNAIWVHGVLANMARGVEFPEFGEHSQQHIDNMNELIRRAAKFNLKVLIYLQPVRSVAAENKEFWKNHADCMGQKEAAQEQIVAENLHAEIEMNCLCTSVPKVKSWVHHAASQLAEKMPALGGVILITCSEYPGHCYSHRVKRNPTQWSSLIECPRCKQREPYEVAAELICLIRDGIRVHSSEMAVIAWNWGWSSWMKAPCQEILDLLPEDVIVMACCERGGTINLAERPNHPVNEYSLIYAGPSKLCRETLAAATSRGLQGMLKLQLGTTHELANVINLPMISSIYEKAKWLRQYKNFGYMGCWNFGNQLSANTCAFNFFLDEKCPDDKTVAMSEFAKIYFPGCKSEKVIEAWNGFQQAARYFPYAIPFLYRGVQTVALAYSEIFKTEELHGEPFGCGYLYHEKRGDDLQPGFLMQDHEFSLDELIGHLGKMAVLWERCVECLKEGLEGCDEKYELGNAVICGTVWQSSENIYRAWRLRRSWKDACKTEMLHILLSELETIKKALPWVEKDERQGWHGEAFAHLFDAKSMQSKIDCLKRQIAQIHGKK